MTLAGLLLGLITTTVTYTATPVQAAPLTISVTDERQLDGEATTTDPVACSCTAYAHFLDPRIPYINAEDMELNSVLEKGHLAVFYYPKSRLYHVAMITAVGSTTFTVKESNYKRCQYDTREVRIDDKSIIGYYAP